MPDFTNAYKQAYDALRKAKGPSGDLTLYDNDGNSVDTVTTGWKVGELRGEESNNGRVSELRVLDLGESDFNDVIFFGWGGYRYERIAPPNPPVNNPREWVWQVQPVGVES